MTAMSPPKQPDPMLPAKPERRPAPCRSHTLLFWTVLLLFVAAIGYLGLLALGGRHLISRAVIDLHPQAEIVVAICAIVAVAGAVVSRYHIR